MRKKLFKIGVAAAGLVITTAAVAGVSYAHNNFGRDGKINPKHEMISMIDNNDFNAWKGMMLKKGMDEGLLTEENFDKMKEAHQLAREGRFDKANALKAELGEMGFGHKKKWNKKIDKEKFEAVMNALDNKDYQAWKDAVGKERAAEVTADEFPQLLQAHNLMREGKEKFKQAGDIRRDIGLKAGPNKMLRHKWQQ